MIISQDKSNVKKVITALKKGQVVILPTDTLYALSCDASNPQAVEKIYKLKQREKLKALPIMCSDIEQVVKIGELDNLGYVLARHFWPGALTLILKRRVVSNSISSKIYESNTDIAVRIPKSEFLLQLIKEFGTPLVGTSANISGEEPILNANQAEKVFGKEIMVVDGGVIKGKPSTVIKIEHNSYEIIREGDITPNAIDNIITKPKL